MANDDQIPSDAKPQGDGAISFKAQCSCGKDPHDPTCVSVEVITPKPGPDLDAYMQARSDANGAPQALATAAVNLRAVKVAAARAKGWRERRTAAEHVSVWRKTLEIAADKYAESYERLRSCQDKLIADALTDPERPERGPAPVVSAEDVAAGRWPGGEPHEAKQVH